MSDVFLVLAIVAVLIGESFMVARAVAYHQKVKLDGADIFLFCMIAALHLIGIAAFIGSP
jgi:hypothetical protein